MDAASIGYYETLVAIELPILNHVHGFDARDVLDGRVEGLDLHHRAHLRPECAAALPDGFFKEAACRCQLPPAREQDVHCLPQRVDSSAGELSTTPPSGR